MNRHRRMLQPSSRNSVNSPALASAGAPSRRVTLSRLGALSRRSGWALLAALLPGACADDEPSTAVESALPAAPAVVVQPNQPAVTPVTPAAREGALIDVTASSQVGVVLDEIPEALRAPLVAYYLAQPAKFWIDRAEAQLKHTSYQLTYRNEYYDESENKGMLALPPREVWQIDLAPEGPSRVTTADGHDAVAVDYTFSSTLLSDTETPAQSDPAFAEVGGMWAEPFSLPLDPEFVLQRTGYACIDEDGYPLNTADSENVAQVFDGTCEVETPDEPSCHLTEYPTESCVEALERAVGRVDVDVLFERAAYTAEAADAVRVESYTETAGPDLAVIPEGLDTNRITYRYIDADSCALAEGCVSGTGWRRLLLYDASIKNVSPVNLEVGPVTDDSPFVQRNVFEFSECHQHFHYSHYGNFTYGDLPGEKRAFCIESTDRYFNSEQTPLAHPFGCDNQGVASGWGDTYIAGVECNWIDITDLQIPGDSTQQKLEFDLNPDGFICEGAPVVDASGVQVFTPTDQVGENGGPVAKPSCDYVDGYEANDVGTRNVTVPKDGGFITTACTRGQAGPLRDCGFSEQAENLRCEPGSTVQLSCSVPAGAPAQALRVCENSFALGGVTACMYREALATAVVQAGATTATFPCPAARSDVETGGYGYFAAPLLPTDAPAPVTCVVADPVQQ